MCQDGLPPILFQSTPRRPGPFDPGGTCGYRRSNFFATLSVSTSRSVSVAWRRFGYLAISWSIASQISSEVDRLVSLAYCSAAAHFSGSIVNRTLIGGTSFQSSAPLSEGCACASRNPGKSGPCPGSPRLWYELCEAAR